MEAKLQVCWTLCVFWVLGLGLGLALLAGWFLEAWELCWFGYRLSSSCCWASMAWLSAVKFFSCCLIIRASSSAWARWLIWSKAIWNSRSMPDVWFWSVLQAVGTRGVLCVFSQDLERPFTFGSSGLQCSEAIPDGFASLVCFVLFGGWFCVWNLVNFANHALIV